MNAMVNALQTAGIKITIGKRIWMWLVDHPGHTTTQISKGLGIVENTVAGQLWTLEKRKMVTRIMHKLPGRNKQVSNWSVTIKEYELLPMKWNGKQDKSRKVGNVQVKDKITLTPQPMVVAGEFYQPTQSVITKLDLLEQLNVKDAYAMYLELHKMFGGHNA